MPISSVASGRQEGNVVFKLYEKGYFYGKNEIGTLVSGDKKFTAEVHDLVLKLNKAVTDRNLADNKRSSEKTQAFLSKGGSFWRWRQAVNDLNAQKERVDTIVKKIINVLETHDQFDIIQRNEHDEAVSVKNMLMVQDQKRLCKIFTDGVVQFA